MAIKDNLPTFIWLMRRDLKVLLSNFTSVIIDSAVHSSCFILLFGFLLPAMGMEKKLSLPLFLGSVILTLISTSFSRAVSLKSSVEFTKFINFYLMLPISKNWLIFQYILAFVIDLFLASAPILILGIFILNPESVNNILQFIPMYLITLFFLSVLFLLIVFSTRWQWFINNTWERILVPMSQFGCILFVWSNLFKFWPFFAKIVLINPMTYISEGFRGALVEQNPDLTLDTCFLVIFFVTLILYYLLIKAFNKFLDPV